MSKFGYVIASRMLVDNRLPVMFMYRERPSGEDSGWRFLSGLEEQNYLDDPDNIGVYDVEEILEIDPTVQVYLGSLPRRAYMRKSPGLPFARATDFDFEKDDPAVTVSGTALASRKLIEDRLPVMIMYRVEPDGEDTGWRFYSGQEDDAYLEDPDNLVECDIRAILELDPGLAVYVDLEAPRAYERTDPDDPLFHIVTFDDVEEEDVDGE